jgi:methyl-accepting chemotaxis protein
MSIARKLLLALVSSSTIVAICVAIPLGTYIGLKAIGNELIAYEAQQEEISLSQELQLQAANIWQFMTDASLTRERDSIDKEAKAAFDKSQQILNKLAELNKNDPDDLKKVQALQAALPIMWQKGSIMFDAYGRSHAEGNAAMAEYDKACDRVLGDSAEFTALSKKLGKERRASITAGLATVTTRVSASGTLATLIGLFVVFIMLFLRRSITHQLQTIVEEVDSIAAGNLQRQFDTHGNDEISRVSRAVNQLIGELRTIITRIVETASQVATAAQQLDGTSRRIVSGSAEVAAESSTIATASEEMAATSGDIARNCQMAADSAQSASASASRGADVVASTVGVMAQIAERVEVSARTVESLGARSDQIGAIIGTIEDIADQTNLLALNAAIEAARAGEQGRGFAVVADEVRALAERTTKATREIGEMIKTIQSETKEAVIAMEQGVNQVESGTAEAAKSGEALKDILEQINTVNLQVSQIATAAEQQTATTSEISGNMHKIMQEVDNTSHGAEESAAAAAQLSSNAGELQRLVQFFKL